MFSFCQVIEVAKRINIGGGYCLGPASGWA